MSIFDNSSPTVPLSDEDLYSSDSNNTLNQLTFEDFCRRLSELPYKAPLGPSAQVGSTVSVGGFAAYLLRACPCVLQVADEDAPSRATLRRLWYVAIWCLTLQLPS
jgi:hypothetical protein